MRRRVGMWMAVICILVVGISVTKMTTSFIASNSAEMAAASDVRSLTEAMAKMAPAAGVMQNETGAGKIDSGPEEGNLPADPEPEAGAVPRAAAFLAETESSEKQENAAGEQVAAAESAQDAEAPEDSATAETVKSPLDPMVSKENTAETEEDLTASYGAEDFLKRFENAEICSLKFWENVTPDNVGAGSAAAEQERALWDHELNLVYRTIRSRMTEQEAEELKILELEWLKERDRYADKEAGKSAGINGISPEYSKALTVKTKERCYWLVSEYEEILNKSAGNGAVKN